MSTAVFPTLIGLEWNVERSPIFNNIIQDAVSGKQTAISLWSYPKYRWTLSFSYLPSRVGATDLQSLMGFFNLRGGRFDTFQYADADDYTVTDQQIGIGDGATTDFQLVAAFGGFTQPILAPHTITNVKVGGVTKTPGVDYNVSVWGSIDPGVVSFTSPPASGAITVTYTYYFPCRFDDDSITFKNFMRQMWSQNGVSFTSQK